MRNNDSPKSYKKANYIRCIFYMLAYTQKDFNTVKFEEMNVGEFEFEVDNEYIKIFAFILKNHVSLQLKRGLNKNYNQHTDSLVTLRGKIDVSQSIKQLTMMKSQLVCHFDEFNENVKFNQIIKTAFIKLLRLLKNIENDKTKSKNNIKEYSDLRKDIRNLLLYFNNVDVILDCRAIDWNISYNRNNQTYRTILLISKFILENDIIPVEDPNAVSHELKPIFDDKSLENLYDDFLLQFYRKELSGKKGVNVHERQKIITWASLGTNEEYIKKLPQMRTDVYIENYDKNEICIIDAKFYSKVTKKRNFKENVEEDKDKEEKDKFISDNLYQINNYVQNEKINKSSSTVKGMLIYVEIDEPIAADYCLMGNNIFIRTVNLSNGEKKLKEDLLKYYEELTNASLNEIEYPI